MSNKRITQLPIVNNTNPTDVIPIVSGGVTSQISVGDFESSSIIPQYTFRGEWNSFNNQVIGASDNPLQITFGSASFGPDSVCYMDGFGNLKFFKSGSFLVNVDFTLARQGTAGGTSAIILSGNFGTNGQIIPSIFQKLTGATEIRNCNTTFVINVTDTDIANDEFLNFVITRDAGNSVGNGASEGGLYKFEFPNIQVTNAWPSNLKIHQLNT